MVDRFIYLRHSKVWADQEDGTFKIDLPFSQHQAPHSWGFLFIVRNPQSQQSAVEHSAVP